jgi:hypothetical protein
MNRNATDARSTSGDGHDPQVIRAQLARAQQLIDELAEHRNNAQARVLALQTAIARLGERDNARALRAIGALAQDVLKPLQEADQGISTGSDEIDLLGEAK